MGVSLKDVAAIAGVAPITVSRVLNNSPLVTDITRTKVLAACRSIDYRPHAGARALRSKRFNTIGLLLPAEEGHMLLPHSLLASIADELEHRRIALQIIQLSDRQLTDADFMPRVLTERMVDGLLINYSVGIPDKLTTQVKEHNLPSVWINIKRSYDCIYPDMFNGARKVAEHLIKLGHQRIGFLDFTNNAFFINKPHYSVKDTYDGVCDAIEKTNFGSKLEIICKETIERKDRLSFMQGVLGRIDYPRAIITVSYRHALTCLHAALSLGIRVPEDLSIVTFYEKSIYDETGLAFDTVSVPEAEMGRAAVDMLLKKINHHENRIPSLCVDMPFTIGDTSDYRRKAGR